MLISPLLYIKWFSVDVLISLVTGIEPDLFILSFENYWNCLSLFGWQEKRKKKERIQIVSESFPALVMQAKLDIPGDRVRSIRFKGRQRAAWTSCWMQEVQLGQDDVGCDCCAAKETIANMRFVQMHSVAWEVLSQWPGRHSPSDSSWKSLFSSRDLSGLSRAAWQNVQVLVSLGLLSVGDARFLTMEKKSVWRRSEP